MITSLRVRNFKRFADASFVLRPLTVLIGIDSDTSGRAITYRLHVPNGQPLYLRVRETCPTVRPS